jgi:hypothetical protein
MASVPETQDEPEPFSILTWPHAVFQGGFSESSFSNRATCSAM